MKNWQVVIPAIIIITLVILGFWQLVKNQVFQPKPEPTPQASPVNGFPSSEESSPFPTPAGFNQPETGITPQSLPATGGR